MAIYSVRRFRRRYRKGNVVRVRLGRFRSRVSKRIVQLFYRSLSRRSGFRKNARFSKSISSSSSVGKLIFSSVRSPSRSFKGKSGSRRRFFTGRTIQTVGSFKALKVKQQLSIIQIYKVSRFQNSSNKRLKLLLSYNSRNLNQDKDYFILSKLDLFKFGLPQAQDNSIDELLLSLLFFWRFNLESSRISVVYYRHLNFYKDSQWVQGQFILVNILALSSKREEFPSPVLLSI